MNIQFEYPEIWELNIQKIEAVGINGEIIASLERSQKDKIWYAVGNVEGDRCIYKFLMNDYIYISDPYAHEYTMINGKVWSVRYNDMDAIENEIERIEAFDIVVSNQMNHAVRASKMQKIFYAQFEKRVNVGVEFYSVWGVHELAVVWERPGRHIYHIDYKVIEPEQEGERYAMINWFKMLLSEVDRELLTGMWIVEILLDGVLIGFEPFEVKEDWYGDFIEDKL